MADSLSAGSPFQLADFGSFTTFGNGGIMGGGSGSPLGGGSGTPLGGGNSTVLDAFGNPTSGGSNASGSDPLSMLGGAGGISGIIPSSFLTGFALPQDQQPGATGESGAISPGQLGMNQNGPSAMSQLFGAVGNLMQRAGLVVLGVVLIGIGAWFLARPAVERAGAKIAKVVAA